MNDHMNGVKKSGAEKVGYNAAMKPEKSLLMWMFFALILSACTAPQVPLTASATPEVQLTPYSTFTSTPTITTTPVNAPTATLAPTATPTPRIYIVKAKDTLGVIAYLNGLTVDELKAANPTVDPYAMPVGTKLVIPMPRSAALTPSAAEPTPVPVQVNPVDCAPAATGGLYCFSTVENSQAIAVSNFSAEFQMTDPSSKAVVSQKALLPVNVLAPGSELPVFAFFTPPTPAQPQVELKVLTSSALATPPAPGIDMKAPQVVISPDAYWAAVSGSGVYTEAASTDKILTVIGASFDAQGKVNGIRRMDIPIDISAGSKVSYSLNVYSTRGTIAKVLVYAETHP
jgi:LysM repeat protein